MTALARLGSLASMRLSLAGLALGAAAACSDAGDNDSAGGKDSGQGVAIDTPAGAPDGTPGTAADIVSSDSQGSYVTGACTAGELGCLDAATAAICANGIWQPGATCTSPDYCTEGLCATPGNCTPGTVTGCAALDSQRVCNAAGNASVPQACPDEQLCANGSCRAVACVPGAPSCTDFTRYHVCKADGSGFEDEQACGDGESCVGGKCLALCEVQIKFTSHVGCEYWSVDLDNDPIHNPVLPNQLTPEMFPHSVVITNPNEVPVKVTFSVAATCGDGSACSPSKTTCNGQQETVCDAAGGVYDLVMADGTVPAGESREFDMPVMNVHGSGIARKGIRIRTSLPVVAYQFNPFDSENAASNDGSLLLPKNGLGKDYYAVSLPSRAGFDLLGFPPNYGFLTVAATATVPTTVQVTPTVDLLANPGAGVPQDGTTPKVLAAGGTYSFVLQPFDVLNLSQEPSSKPLGFGEIPKDLTGSHIHADQPVAVFGGHQVAGVSDDIKVQTPDEWDTCCTEHLEEQLMPVEAWGTSAYCIKSKTRGYERDQWIVVAGEDNVTVHTDPPVSGLDGKTLAKAGDRLRAQTDESFMLSASGKVQVVQFLESQGQTQTKNSGTPGTGDPTMMLIPPSKQYRDVYVIRTAGGYSENWTTVIRPKGLVVKVDGAALPNGVFNSFGDGTWEYAYEKLETGTHRFEAEGAFGLMVYGYGNVTAYGYPGGMNLAQ